MPCLSRINAEGSDCAYFVPQFCYSYFKLFQGGNQLKKQTCSIHTYNIRYAASQNLCKSRVRTNTGIQTIFYMASLVWHNIPSYLKNLNVYQFSK